MVRRDWHQPGQRLGFTSARQPRDLRAGPLADAFITSVEVSHIDEVLMIATQVNEWLLFQHVRKELTELLQIAESICLDFLLF